MLASVIEIILTNHLYLFDGKVYRQAIGGPIGENITQVSAKIVMWLFTRGYRKKLCQLSLNDQILLMKIYVDDLNQVGYCLPIGSRYTNGKLYIPGQGWRGRAARGQAIPPKRIKEIKCEAEEAKILGGIK